MRLRKSSAVRSTRCTMCARLAQYVLFDPKRSLPRGRTQVCSEQCADAWEVQQVLEEMVVTPST